MRSEIRFNAHRVSLIFALFGLLWFAAVAANASDAVSEADDAEDDRFWNEVYLQTVYSSYDRNNIIADLSYRSGIHWFRVRNKDVDLYLKFRSMVDRNGDFWNNLGEAGVGMRYRPFDRWGLVLLHEAMGGGYTRLNLPDDQEILEPTYWDYRAGFAFWQWWGKQPYEVAGHELYVPFAGWREVYADGLFLLRDNRNFVSSLSWREGLAMGRIGKTQYDAFLQFQAGGDANGDYWNNYVKVGPGLRIKPFEKHDLSLSFAWMKGMYFRGDTEDVSDRFADFNVALAWSFSF